MKLLSKFNIMQILIKLCLFTTAVDYAAKSLYVYAFITFLVFIIVETLFIYKDNIENFYNEWYGRYLYKKEAERNFINIKTNINSGIYVTLKTDDIYIKGLADNQRIGIKPIRSTILEYKRTNTSQESFFGWNVDYEAPIDKHYLFLQNGDIVRFSTDSEAFSSAYRDQYAIGLNLNKLPFLQHYSKKDIRSFKFGFDAKIITYDENDLPIDSKYVELTDHGNFTVQ